MFIPFLVLVFIAKYGSFSQKSCPYQTYKNHDIDGKYYIFTMKGSPDECCVKCEAMTDCVAFTYFYDYNSSCWFWDSIQNKSVEGIAAVILGNSILGNFFKFSMIFRQKYDQKSDR